MSDFKFQDSYKEKKQNKTKKPIKVSLGKL